MRLDQDGSYTTGCNYWASHAGTEMWLRWDEDVVRKDLKTIAGAGMRTLRVFPLWRDFQPLELHTTCMSMPRELRMAGGAPLPDTEAGRAGVSEEALLRFKKFADIATENGLDLIVALVTGWMSGRLFAPPAFAGLNPLSDPLAVKWEVRFVRHFVKTFKGHPAILAWELGNECNCMGKVESRAEAWNWTNAMASAIRLEDSSRTLASGMHGLYPESDAEFNAWDPKSWTMQDQGELTDLLCAHPYPHSPSKKAARVDPVGSLRTAFQAVVEARLYSDIGAKPCLVEEIGTFGPMVCGEPEQTSFLRDVLLNTWAHDSRGLLWWCAFDQSHLNSTPYDWNAWERELGLFKGDSNPKPLCEEFGKFRDFRDSLPFKALPSFRRDAVCILTKGMSAEDTLSNAWSCFLLAKQAGFDIEFQYAGDPLKESGLYLMPGIKGPESVSLRQWRLLQEKVEKGATLYVSVDDGHLCPFNEVFGLGMASREERETEAVFSFDAHSFNCKAQYRLGLRMEGAEAIAMEEDGNPLLTRFKKGKGETWFMGAPIERHLGAKPKAFDKDAQPFHLLYRKVAAKAIGSRILRRDDPHVTVTEHLFDAKNAACVLVNNSDKAANCGASLLPGWSVKSSFPCATDAGIPEIPPYGGILILLNKQT